MAKSDEFAFMDATALAELVKRREVTASELVDAAINRIEHVNPVINAVVTPMYEQAHTMAAGKLPNGPFTGVPFLLKDMIASYAGVRMTQGSSFMRDFVATTDSELVVRLKHAGLIIIGKTSTPELGLLPTTEPRLFGPSRNPWNTSRSTGGSSGGSAAAVAAGLVPMAHANDGGGSIRVPASNCGLFGLKPTRARNPLGPTFGDVMSGLVVEHAVTRTVRDCATLLDATSGPELGDPYHAPAPKRPFLKEVGADPGRLRIAFTTKAANGVPVHGDCIDAVHDAAALCGELGYEVEEAAPSIDGGLVGRAFMTLWSVGCAWMIDSAASSTGREPVQDQFEPSTWAIYERGRKRSAAAYLSTLTTLQSVSRIIAQFFSDYDLLLTPTLAEPPLPLGSFDSPPEDPMYAHRRTAAFTPFTLFYNITGQPAMSVPLFWNDYGLPIGVHCVGRFGDEATLFRLAAQLETARPWANHHPPVSA